MDKDIICMQMALEEARRAALREEVPVGAILVHAQTGEVAARAGNETIARHDPTAHAETLVIREVCARLGVQRIPEYDLYVTLEPCTLCAAAISFARIRRLVFAASDPKGGGVLHGAKFYGQPTCHHRPEIAHGPLAVESGVILKEFFRLRRNKPV